MSDDVYGRLARHFSGLAMGPPLNEHLVSMLRESFTGREAEILLRLPSGTAPFEAKPLSVIAADLGCAEGDLAPILDGLAERGLIYRREEGAEKKYALHQFGYGMPQAIFWPNEDTPFARRMAELVINHSKGETLTQAFGGPDSKVYRWLPVGQSIQAARQAVLPHATLEQVIDGASLVALVNCHCRVLSRLKGRPPCSYPLDVCMKLDEMGAYVVDVGIGRKISKDEAIAIVHRAEEAGLVHFADNVLEGEVKQVCNCCPCCCWSLGSLARRRVPRDLLMACQFIRETNRDACAGCGACVDACPLKAVSMEDGVPRVDNDWCIGCGVCALACPSEAIAMTRRQEIQPPFPNFQSLAQQRLREKTAG